MKNLIAVLMIAASLSASAQIEDAPPIEQMQEIDQWAHVGKAGNAKINSLIAFAGAGLMAAAMVQSDNIEAATGALVVGGAVGLSLHIKSAIHLQKAGKK